MEEKEGASSNKSKESNAFVKDFSDFEIDSKGAPNKKVKMTHGSLITHFVKSQEQKQTEDEDKKTDDNVEPMLVENLPKAMNFFDLGETSQNTAPSWFQETSNTNPLLDEQKSNKSSSSQKKGTLPLSQKASKVETQEILAQKPPDQNLLLKNPLIEVSFLLQDKPIKDLMKNVWEEYKSEYKSSILPNSQETKLINDPSDVIFFIKLEEENFTKHTFTDVKNFVSQVNTTTQLNARLANIAAFLLHSLTADVGNVPILDSFMNKIKCPDLKDYIAFLFERKGSKFHISASKNDEFAHCISNGDLNNYSLTRLIHCKFLLSQILHFIFSENVEFLKYENNIKIRRSTEITSNKMSALYGKKSSPLPGPEDPDLMRKFWTNHALRRSDKDIHTFENLETKTFDQQFHILEMFPNNQENLICIDVFKEFCEGEPKPSLFEYAELGALLIDENGTYQKLDPVNPPAKRFKAKTVSKMSNAFGDMKKRNNDNKDLSISICMMSVKFYTQSWNKLNIEKRVPSIADVWTGLSYQNMNPKNFLDVVSAPIRFANLQQEKNEFIRKLDTDKDFYGVQRNWDLAQDFFENDGFLLYTPFLFLKDFDPKDEWSLYFKWSAAISSPYKLGLYHLACYFKHAATLAYENEYRRLSIASENGDKTAGNIIKNYFNKEWLL